VFNSFLICIFIEEYDWFVLSFILLAVTILKGIHVVSKVAMEFKANFLCQFQIFDFKPIDLEKCCELIESISTKFCDNLINWAPVYLL
jgi:hypothetical protein